MFLLSTVPFIPGPWRTSGVGWRGAAEPLEDLRPMPAVRTVKFLGQEWVGMGEV